MTEQAASTEAPVVTAADLPAGAVPDQAYIDKTLAAQHGDPAPSQIKPAGPVRPDYVPEQFWDADKGTVKAEDLAKSYAELRSKMDAGKAAEEPPKDADGKPTVKIEKDGKPADEAPKAEPAPLATLIDDVAKAYATSGEINEDQVKGLEAQGIPRATIDIYMAGLKALETAAITEVHKAAGGEEQFNSAVAWAKANLSDADLAYYNDNVDDAGKRVQTVEWLMGKFGAARPSEGTLLEGAAPSADAGDVYTTPAQVTAAMRDPKYKSDPAFREAVANKMLRSQRAGTLDASAEYFNRS